MKTTPKKEIKNKASEREGDKDSVREVREGSGLERELCGYSCATQVCPNSASI